MGDGFSPTVRLAVYSSTPRLLDSNDTAEAEVVGTGVDGVRHAGGGTVALAVVGRTGEAASFEHPARDGGDIVRVDALLLRALLMDRGTPTTGVNHLVLGGIPVGRPLPDVADHVGQAVIVRREATHGSGALIAIEDQVLPG